jgi:hypothetical protein
MKTSPKLAPLALAFTAFALTVGHVAPARADENGMPKTAFLFEARIGGSVAFGVTAGLLVGARIIDRLHLGLGFALVRTDSTGAGSNNRVNFAPTVAVDIVKAHDNRVAFYGKFALPVGPLIACPPGNGACDTGLTVGFDFGLGVRYAFHRMFALGMEAGAVGAFDNPQRDNHASTVTFYGALVGTFWYGK